MYVAQSSRSEWTDDSQLQSQTEESDSHKEIHAGTKFDDDKQKSKHKKRKRAKRPNDKKSHKNGKDGKKSEYSDENVKQEEEMSEQKDKTINGADSEKPLIKKDETNPESTELSQEETSDESRKAVSWKENIETTKEFQNSVLEQNVVVNLEVPDEEYDKKGIQRNADHLESYGWNPVSCGPNISVLDKKPYTAQRLVAKQSTDGARGSQGFSQGRHTIRFKFNNKPWGSNCSIGVCTADASLHKKGFCHLFGEDGESWAWDIPSGSLHHNGQVTQHYISSIEEKLIYMTLDFNKGCLYFQPKDRDRFLAFKGITSEKELFPCVSMVYGFAEVKLGLKHSTDDSIKLLKQERQIKEVNSKNRSKSIPVEGTTKGDESDLNTSETTQASNEEGEDQGGSAEKTELNQLPPSPSNTEVKSDETEQDTDNTPGEEDPEKKTIELERKTQETTDVEHKPAMRFEDTEKNEDMAEKEENKNGNLEEAKDDDEEVEGSLVNTKGSLDQALNDPRVDGEAEEENEVSSFMSRGQPDGEKQGDREKDRLYKKSSSLSWADSWQDNDLTHVTSDCTNSTCANLAESVECQHFDPLPPPPAVYIPPRRHSQLHDLEEPEDAKYTEVCSLEEPEQYGIQLSHGWDVTNRGGTIHLYPNIPYLCVPMPSFSDKVQGIRGRQGFKTGIHKWKITEVKTFSPNVPLSEMHLAANKLHIGVVSEEQRTFNYGYNLTAVGPHMWTYELDTSLIWHGQSKIQDLTLTAGSGSSSEGEAQGVDMTKGLDVELNFYKHLLTLRYQDRVIAQIKQIRAKHLFPFVLFNKKAVFPVEIQYLEGPEDYVAENLAKLEKKESLDREDLVNYRGLTRQMSSKTNIVVVEHELLKTYNWGKMSDGLKIKTLSGGNVIHLSKGTFQEMKHFVALAEKPLFGQRHKIDFTTKQIDSCIFGLASEALDESEFSKQGGISNTDATVSVLGNNVHSWAWDPKACALYHGGRYLGRYPSRAIDFDLARYDRLRLLVDFSSTGYNIASFTAMSTEARRPLDLGIAFVNLPSSVYPCVAVLSGGEKENVQVTLDYVSGPKGFVTNIVQAKTCNIL